MTTLQQKLFALTKESESLRAQLKANRAQLEEVLKELGTDTYHKNDETGTVYKIVEPSGTFIEFRKIDYVRTALVGEARGTLSKKEAEENFHNLVK